MIRFWISFSKTDTSTPMNIKKSVFFSHLYLFLPSGILPSIFRTPFSSHSLFASSPVIELVPLTNINICSI